MDDVLVRLARLRDAPPWPYLQDEARSVIIDAMTEIERLRNAGSADSAYVQASARHGGFGNGLFK